MGWSVGSSGRGFGIVYIALDRMRNNYVAIKEVKMARDETVNENEVSLLRGCQSSCIVRYYNMIRTDDALWVRIR